MPPRGSATPSMDDPTPGEITHLSPPHTSVARPSSSASSASSARRSRDRPLRNNVQSTADSDSPHPASYMDLLPDIVDVDRSDRLDDLNPIPAQLRNVYTPAELDTLAGPPPDDPLRNFNPLLSLDELLDESPSTEALEPTRTNRLLSMLDTSRRPASGLEIARRQDLLSHLRSRERALRATFPGLDVAAARHHRREMLRNARDIQRLEDTPLDQPLDAGEDTDEDEDDDMGSEGDDFMPEWEYSADDAGRFRLANRSTDDLAVLGGSGARVTLRRGAYNRNRRSIMERIRGREAEVPDEGILVSTEVVRRSGMRPTNPVQHPRPEIISTPARKHKEGTISPSRLMKRRKVEEQVEVKPSMASTRPTYLLYTTLPSAIPLPSTFTSPHRLSRVSLSTHKSSSSPPRPCVTFTYSPLPHGPNDDDYASSLRSDIPIPVACGVHYYEAEVLDAGECGYMSVGWMKEHVSLDRLVGWDRGSWGWHGDDGRSFAGRGEGEVFGEGWGKGDIVGCGIDFTTKQGFFTKNGKFIGYRFKDLGEGLHPAIGLRTPHESIAVNFTGPFRYDIDNYVRNVRDTTWRKVFTPPIPKSPDLTAQEVQGKDKKKTKSDVLPSTSSEDPHRSIPSLLGNHAITELELPPSSILQDSSEKTSAAFVLNYLRHEGHEQALRSVRSSMHKRGWIKMKSTPDFTAKKEHDEHSTLEDFSSTEACLAWIHKRTINADTLPLPITFLQTILDGKEIAKAEIQQYLYLLRQAHSARLAASAGGSVSIDVQESDQADEADMKVLQYGQGLKKKSEGWDEDDKERLKEVFGLLSVDPGQWREDGVTGKNTREKDADSIVKAIREKLGMKPTSHLLQAFSQTTASFRLLAPLDPEVAFVDPLRILTDIGCLSSRSTKFTGSVKVERESEV